MIIKFCGMCVSMMFYFSVGTIRMLWHRFYRVVYHLVNNALGTGFPNPILATHTAIRIETTTDFIVSHSVIFTLVFLSLQQLQELVVPPPCCVGTHRRGHRHRPRGRWRRGLRPRGWCSLQMDGGATQGTSPSRRLAGQWCPSGITTTIVGDDNIPNFLWRPTEYSYITKNW